VQFLSTNRKSDHRFIPPIPRKSVASPCHGPHHGDTTGRERIRDSGAARDAGAEQRAEYGSLTAIDQALRFFGRNGRTDHAVTMLSQHLLNLEGSHGVVFDHQDMAARWGAAGL
jgi:hypothetical protein